MIISDKYYIGFLFFTTVVYGDSKFDLCSNYKEEQEVIRLQSYSIRCFRGKAIFHRSNRWTKNSFDVNSKSIRKKTKIKRRFSSSKSSKSRNATTFSHLFPITDLRRENGMKSNTKSSSMSSMSLKLRGNFDKEFFNISNDEEAVRTNRFPMGKIIKIENMISSTQSPMEKLHHSFINFISSYENRKKKMIENDQKSNQIRPKSTKNVDDLYEFYRNYSTMLHQKLDEFNVSESTRLLVLNWTNLGLFPVDFGPSEIDNESMSVRGGQKNRSLIFDTETIVRIFCYSVIFLCGIIGNSMVMITLVKNRKMRTITNVFILNLAISDLLLGVFCMPFTLLGSLLRDFVFGSIMCKLIPYIQAISVFVSVWTLVAISLERHYAICHPLQSRGWQTLSHAYKVITLVWIMSLVLLVPIAVLSQLVPIGNHGRHKCREVWPFMALERTFSLFLATILLVIPLIIMVTAYASISFSLWHGMNLEKRNGQVISMTADLSSVAVAQRSIRNHNSTPKKEHSKIAIRFRKFPTAPPICAGCHSGEPSGTSQISQAHDSGGTNHRLQVKVEAGNNGTTSNFRSNLYEPEDDDDWSMCKEHCPNVRGPRKILETRKLRSTHLEKSITAKKRVIKMLFVVVFEFFICWTPIFIVNILYLFVPQQVYAYLGSNGVSFFHLLSYASSCCNPITYCFMNRKFLQLFKKELRCCKFAKKKQDTAMEIRNVRTASVNNSFPVPNHHVETQV